MPRSLDRFAHAAAREAASDAILAPERWMDMLAHTAEATGSRIGQLVGWIDARLPPLFLMTEDFSMHEERWIALGGADPRVNPVIATALAMPAGTLVRDHEELDREARRGSALWQGFYEAVDIPHLGSVILDKSGGVQLALSVLRSREEGPLEGEAARIFQDCARAAAASATLVRTLGESAAAHLIDGLGMLDAAAVALDGYGQMLGLSPAAEPLIARTGAIAQAGHRIEVAEADRHRWQSALDQVLRGVIPAPLMLAGPAATVRVKLLPLPHRFGLGLGARALMLLDDVSAEIALTAAERDVLALLRSGRSLHEIADTRGVSRETARTQAKAIYAKLGITGQRALLRG